MRQVQVDGLALYLRTKHLRFYSSNVVPALLQTPAYATALIGTISQFRRLPKMWRRPWRRAWSARGYFAKAITAS